MRWRARFSLRRLLLDLVNGHKSGSPSQRLWSCDKASPFLVTSNQATLALGRPNFLGVFGCCFEISSVAMSVIPGLFLVEVNPFPTDINKGGVRRGCNQRHLRIKEDSGGAPLEGSD